MFRWLTAGESHGRALVAICEGVPAGVRLSTEDVAAALARRRAGYGRGARMAFEQDEVAQGLLASEDERRPVACPGNASGPHFARKLDELPERWGAFRRDDP